MRNYSKLNFSTRIWCIAKPNLVLLESRGCHLVAGFWRGSSCGSLPTGFEKVPFNDQVFADPFHDSTRTNIPLCRFVATTPLPQLKSGMWWVLVMRNAKTLKLEFDHCYPPTHPYPKKPRPETLVRVPRKGMAWQVSGKTMCETVGRAHPAEKASPLRAIIT